MTSRWLGYILARDSAFSSMWHTWHNQAGMRKSRRVAFGAATPQKERTSAESLATMPFFMPSASAFLMVSCCARARQTLKKRYQHSPPLCLSRVNEREGTWKAPWQCCGCTRPQFLCPQHRSTVESLRELRRGGREYNSHTIAHIASQVRACQPVSARCVNTPAALRRSSAASLRSSSG